MKYTAGKVRHIRDDIYQARFTWYEERQGKKVAHQVARNFRAGSNREAEQKRAAIHAQLEREAEIERIMPAKTEPAQTDIADYLYSYARMRECAGAIEKTTLANYRSSTKHILRYIHDIPVSKITAPMVLHMDKMLLADGLVPDTVSAAHRFLKQVLDHAEDVGDIERNPITRAVKPPKRQRREPNGLEYASSTRATASGSLSGAATTELTRDSRRRRSKSGSAATNRTAPRTTSSASELRFEPAR